MIGEAAEDTETEACEHLVRLKCLVRIGSELFEFALNTYWPKMSLNKYKSRLCLLVQPSAV